METNPEHLTNKFVETGATETSTGDVLWEANHIQTDTVRIVDPGIGKERIVRNFFFKGLSLPKNTPKPTKRDIIESYKHLIGNMLWADGLSPIVDEEIRLYTKAEVKQYPHLRKKFREEKADFVIMIMCEARLGQNILDTVHRAT